MPFNLKLFQIQLERVNYVQLPSLLTKLN